MDQTKAIQMAKEALDKAVAESPQDRVFSYNYMIKDASKRCHINGGDYEKEKQKFLVMLYIAIYELSDRKAITPSTAAFLRTVLEVGPEDDVAWPLKKANKTYREDALADALYLDLMGKPSDLLLVTAYGLAAKGGYTPTELSALAALFAKAS